MVSLLAEATSLLADEGRAEDVAQIAAVVVRVAHDVNDRSLEAAGVVKLAPRTKQG